MRPAHRLFAAALAALASASVLAVAAAPAGAQVKSLLGEHLMGAHARASATCDPLATSTITFSADGPAFGPYTGSFVESGTIELSGLTVVRFESTFTIQAETGEVVTGTKTLVSGSGTAFCSETATDVVAVVNYEARIQTTTGSTFRDRGQATADLRVTCEPLVSCFGTASETFIWSEELLPVFTSGKATGGGQLFDATREEHVTFGFEVKSTEDPNRLQGRCLVLEQAGDTKVKCLDVRNYAQIGNMATWEGTAEVNGVREEYRITVQDNGEPNQGLDTFSIVTESYEAAGNVTHGNVQLHKRQLGL